MAEPWLHDFAALGERTRSHLRSLDATRTRLSAKETKMRLFKTHPALAALATLAILTIAAPIAYAVADRFFLSIDPQQSASEIERSVKSQLDSVGIPATVNADKDEAGNIAVRIQTSDQRLGSNLDVAVPDQTPDDRELQIEIAREVAIQLTIACKLTDSETARLYAALEDDRLSALLHDRDTKSEAELAASITQKLAQDGFESVSVHVEGPTIAVTVSQPPQ